MNRDIWLAREGRSGIYNWIAFSTAQVLSEIPYTITGRGIFYLLYYFMVGFPLGFAAGYSFLMLFMFFLFATSRGQWIAALRWVPTLEHSFIVRYSLTICQSSDSMAAATFMLFFIIMCELYNDILRHHDQMPAFWKYTMYYSTPCTCWIVGVLTAVLGGTPVICDESELSLFESPSNMTCGEYAGPWLAGKGVGYLSNANSTGICGYCPYNWGDDYLSGIGLEDSKIWP